MAQKFSLSYPVSAETLEETVNLVFEIHETTGMDPETITLPDGRTIRWNPYLAHQFAGKGKIDEIEFISLSLSAEE